jgi:hypothetical protein
MGNAGAEEFAKIDTVKDDGLGPTMNLTSCLGCHPATRAAYRADFGLFRAWCNAKGVDALPASPETVAAFLAHEADQGSAASTITRRCAAIRYAHRLADVEPPTNSEPGRPRLRKTLGRMLVCSQRTSSPYRLYAKLSRPVCEHTPSPWLGPQLASAFASYSCAP